MGSLDESRRNTQDPQVNDAGSVSASPGRPGEQAGPDLLIVNLHQPSDVDGDTRRVVRTDRDRAQLHPEEDAVSDVRALALRAGIESLAHPCGDGDEDETHPPAAYQLRWIEE